jgi:hypothetical protein
MQKTFISQNRDACKKNPFLQHIKFLVPPKKMIILNRRATRKSEKMIPLAILYVQPHFLKAFDYDVRLKMNMCWILFLFFLSIRLQLHFLSRQKVFYFIRIIKMLCGCHRAAKRNGKI